MSEFIKYPRTPHLRGSKLQAGDYDLDQLDLADLAEGDLVWEEKVDGANAAFSFTSGGQLQLQSRGHVLRGGAREGQFNLFKAWVETHQSVFWQAVATRYVVYGEWCYAKHTVFYDRLPHFFLEFDIYDRETRSFLSTPARRRLLSGLPIASVPVVHQGPVTGKARKEGQWPSLPSLVRPSLFKSSDWRMALAGAALSSGQDPATVLRETDDSDLSEGLYLKLERGDHVIGRFKYVRADFLQAIVASGSHWQDRPIVRNGLASGVDIFATGAAS